MPDYNVNAKCPHCGNLNFLDRMSEARLARSEAALISILHTLICEQCCMRFGTYAGQLVRQQAD